MINIIYDYFKLNKKISKNAETEKQLDNILLKCKQYGSIEDIEKLKSLIEVNIKIKGSTIDFLEFNFSIAKIYNYMNETESAKEYFEKVKNIVPHINYKDICLSAQKSTENNDFYDAIFYYTYILIYNEVKDNKEIPEIYYNRAIAYLKLNTINDNNKATRDLETAITKTIEISNTLSFIEVETFLEGKLDKYNFKIGEIYQDLKAYDKAISYYNQVLKQNLNLSFSKVNNEYKTEAHKKIQECNKLKQEQEELLRKQKEEKIKQQKELNKKRAESIYNKALKEYKEFQYEKAKRFIENAIKLADNQIYRDLLKDIDYKILQNSKQEYTTINDSKIYSTKKVKLETCNKNDLLTIDGFNEEKADRFIKERDNGKMYYDIESFTAEFGLMPHQMIENEDRLVFPQKPKNKIGRKIDF